MSANNVLIVLSRYSYLSVARKYEISWRRDSSAFAIFLLTYCLALSVLGLGPTVNTMSFSSVIEYNLERNANVCFFATSHAILEPLSLRT